MSNQATWHNTVFNVGNTIAVSQKVKEGDKERLQVFEGIVIAIKNHGAGKSFTVRKISTSQVGVERIWPILCPAITNIKVISRSKLQSKVRRAKLYYLRSRIGKEALKIKDSQQANQGDIKKKNSHAPKAKKLDKLSVNTKAKIGKTG